MENLPDLPDHMQSREKFVYVMYRGVPIPMKKRERPLWDKLTRDQKNTQYRKIKSLIKSGSFILLKDKDNNPYLITKTHHEFINKMNNEVDEDMDAVQLAIVKGVKERNKEKGRPKVYHPDGTVLDKKTKNKRGIK